MQNDKNETEQAASQEQSNEATIAGQAQPQTPSEAQWAFRADDTEAADESAPKRPPSVESVSWTASEYIAHHKTPVWFVGLGAVIAVLGIGIYVFTHDLVAPIMIAIVGMAFGVSAARPPQVLTYVLDERGLHIGSKLYPYDHFKSFSIIEEDAIRSIFLSPLQRFMPPLTIYYDPKDEPKVLDVISVYLPHENRNQDMIDRLMRKIRF